jgi:hypothetical protein|tara:strand:- start:422 stop:724 length:303 start_codon:yes stop_codon:yes gene_type:complete
MGTLQALMPNGAVIEREMSRPGRYSHGLVVQRGIDWVLVSVHTSQAMAHKNRRNLERCFVGGEAFGDFPIFDVVPVIPKVQSFNENHPQPSTTVQSSAAA